MKKCLKFVQSAENLIPGTGSIMIALVYLTIRGLGPSIFVGFSLIYKNIICQFVKIELKQLAVNPLYKQSGLYQNFYNLVQMINRIDECDLVADIKAQIFCEIFDIMTKNMKQNQTIYFYFNHRQMKLGLRQNSKTTQLQLGLSSQKFVTYNCRVRNQYILRKFQLQKFLNFQTYFETCKGNLRLQITYDTLTFKDMNQSRFSIFPVKASSISKSQEQDLKENGFIRERQEMDQYCRLLIQKAKISQEIIRAGNTMKLQKIYISYQPSDKKLKFDLTKEGDAYFKLKVTEQITSKGGSIGRVTIPFKKLKLAMGFLEPEKSYMITLDPQMLVISFDQQNKKRFYINVCAQIDLQEERA